MPAPALVVSAALALDEVETLVDALLDMSDTVEGRQSLAAFGARRFVACGNEVYAPLVEMLELVGDHATDTTPVQTADGAAEGG